MRNLINIFGRGGLTFLIVAVTWELTAAFQLYNPKLFPPPSLFARGFVSMLEEGVWWADVKASMFRYGSGFLLGNSLGIVFGLLTGRIPFLARVLNPLFHYLRSIPSVALIPLAIVWFGIGEMEKIAIVVWGCTFPVWLNTHVGAAEVEREYVWAAKTLGAQGWKMYREVYIPRTFPYVLAGTRISIATGFFALAAAEMAGAYEGIGFRILQSYQFFQTDKMMASILSIGFLALLLDTGFMFLVQRLVPWWEAAKS